MALLYSRAGAAPAAAWWVYGTVLSPLKELDASWAGVFVSTSRNIVQDFSSRIRLRVAEVEVDVVAKLEAEGVEVVLHHVWVEADDCGRRGVEMYGEGVAVVGLLLIHYHCLY